jgi:hypothetical protein
VDHAPRRRALGDAEDNGRKEGKEYHCREM